MSIFSRFPLIFTFLIVAMLSSLVVTSSTLWLGAKKELENFKHSKKEQIHQRMVELQGTLNDFNRRGNQLAIIREVSRLASNRESELVAIIDSKGWVQYSSLAELRESYLPQTYQIEKSFAQLSKQSKSFLGFDNESKIMTAIFPLESPNIDEPTQNQRLYIFARFDLNQSWEALVYNLQTEVTQMMFLHFMLLLFSFTLVYMGIKHRIRRIIHGTNQLASQDYSYRINLEGNDEFHQISSAIDHMAEKLQQQNRQLIELAEKDSLTGLYNRYKFFKLVQNQIKSHPEQAFAIFFIDLDGFKIINDTLGHQTGDKFLVIIGQRLKRLLGKNDLLARFGGDEFCIFYKESSPLALQKHGNAILQTMRTPVVINEQSLFAGASIGVSLYPQDGKNIADLIKTADIAMYHTKFNDKNNFHFYGDLYDKNDIGIIELTSHIKKEIENHQIIPFFQPQVDTHTGKIMGYEALARMKDINGEWLSPDKFIPIIEENGWMMQFSEVMYMNTLNSYQQWLIENEPDDIPILCLNVSTIQLNNTQFFKRLNQCLKPYPQIAANLEIELTENILMENIESKIEVLKKLQEQGIRIALDDFGTGYSSLNYLKQVPLNRLKIDKSFVQDINKNKSSNAIIETIINIAKNLGLEVVTEGVETEEQLAFMQQHNCYLIQGYLTGKPQPLLNEDGRHKPVL